MHSKVKKTSANRTKCPRQTLTLGEIARNALGKGRESVNINDRLGSLTSVLADNTPHTVCAKYFNFAIIFYKVCRDLRREALSKDPHLPLHRQPPTNSHLPFYLSSVAARGTQQSFVFRHLLSQSIIDKPFAEVFFWFVPCISNPR